MSFILFCLFKVMLKNKGMTSFCCYAFIMSSTTFNYEPLKTSQPWLAVTPARGVGVPGNSWWGYAAWFSKF